MSFSSSSDLVNTAVLILVVAPAPARLARDVSAEKDEDKDEEDEDKAFHTLPPFSGARGNTALPLPPRGGCCRWSPSPVDLNSPDK